MYNFVLEILTHDLMIFEKIRSNSPIIDPLTSLGGCEVENDYTFFDNRFFNFKIVVETLVV